MRTDRTQDASGTYSALDVVLVKSPGFKAFIKRLLSRCKWDDVWIVLEWDKELHLAQVVDGRLCYGPNLQQWGGYMVSRQLECKLINFKAKLGTEEKARRFVGQRFRNSANAIGHIFDIECVRSIPQLIENVPAN